MANKKDFPPKKVNDGRRLFNFMRPAVHKSFQSKDADNLKEGLNLKSSSLSKADEKVVINAVLDERRKRIQAQLDLLQEIRLPDQKKTIFNTIASPDAIRCDNPVDTLKSRHSDAVHPLVLQQPQSIELDETVLDEIREHSFVGLTSSIMLAAECKPKVSKGTRKDPNKMSPDELIAWRNENPTEWDTFTKGNTLVSFGLCKPTSADKKKAQKLKKKAEQDKRGKKYLEFAQEVEAFLVPAGQQFDKKETKAKVKAPLKRD